MTGKQILPVPHIGDMPLTIVGDRPKQFSCSALRKQYSTEERTITIACSSSGRSTGTWQGIGVKDLVTAATIPPETTHLLVEARDGYRAPVPIRDALRSFLGLSRIDGPDDTPRLLGERLSSEYAVQNVTRINSLSLTPDEDPEAYASW